VAVDCVQTGQQRTFQATSSADARGPYALEKVVAYTTSVKGAGPQYNNPHCSSAPASASPPVASAPTTPSTAPLPTSAPRQSSSPAPHPPPLPPFATADVSEVRNVYAHLVAVRMHREDGYDRLVLEFADGVPGYTVGYRPLPAQMDASGAEIPLPGASALVQVSLTPATADGWSTGERTYFGPSTVTADTATVTEAKAAGDFEAVLTWVAGLRAKVPFRVLVLDGPPRLVVDFQD